MINYGDILVIGILALVVGLIIGKMLRDRNRGRGCAGCSGCSCTAGCKNCPGCKD